MPCLFQIAANCPGSMFVPNEIDLLSTRVDSYDTLSPPTADAVTTLGSGVDGTARPITTGYSPPGAGYLFTSYDAASGGNGINQVKDEFNGLGRVTKEWQELPRPAPFPRIQELPGS